MNNMKRIFMLALVLMLAMTAACAEQAERWLLCDVNAEYRNLARVGEIDGFALKSIEPGIMDQNLTYFVFEPTREDVPAQTLSVQTGKGDAAAVASQLAGQVSRFGELLYGGEVETFTVKGMNVHSVVIEYRMASSTEGQQYNCIQNAVVYIETTVAQRCVVINAVNMGRDDSAFCDREAMKNMLLGAVEAIELAQ